MSTTRMTPVQEMSAAIRGGEVAKLRAILEAHPHLLGTEYSCGTVLHLAAGYGQVDVMEFLAGLGMAIDARAKNGERPLHCATSKHHLPAAEWLLEHGAQLNEQTGIQSVLTSPCTEGHLEMVRFLVERGVDVNATYTDVDGNPRNALLQAVMFHQHAIADYLRAHGATLPKGMAVGDDVASSLVAHVAETWGPVEPLGLTEIVPTDEGSIAVHVVRPTKGHPQIAMFTEGMSNHAMPVPPGEDGQSAYAEVMLHLPANWPLDLAALRKPEHFWPIQWLRRVAQLPQEGGTWVGKGQVISNGAPPMPFTSNTALSSFLVLPSPDAIGPAHLPDGRTVELLMLVPLYEEERQLYEAKGLKHLLKAFDKHHVPEEIDPQRVNVATFRKR